MTGCVSGVESGVEFTRSPQLSEAAPATRPNLRWPYGLALPPLQALIIFAGTSNLARARNSRGHLGGNDRGNQ